MKVAWVAALVLAGTGAAAPEPPGSLDPFRPPNAKAIELNAAGKIPYRQGKWEEARTQYRAALAADPDFLAPRLNVACSYVRQERFEEATAEVEALLARAYVPWAREVLEAADLGALKVRPEMKRIERAMATSAARWGEGLDQSVLFVARQRAPLRVPDGAGVFVLSPHQEVWAFSPGTRRIRQLTAEDGHVVALAPSPDRRRVLFVTAEKLVRGARPDDVALRGVAVRELVLASMSLGPRVAVEGDVRSLSVIDDEVLKRGKGGRPDVLRHFAQGSLLELTTDRGHAYLRLAGAALVPATAGRGAGPATVTLTGRGVERKGAPAAIPAPQGAGLFGLPIP